jgi:hypothetical protein
MANPLFFQHIIHLKKVDVNDCRRCFSRLTVYTSFTSIDISQYRLLFGFFLLYSIRTVFRLNCSAALPSYEVRAAVEGGK